MLPCGARSSEKNSALQCEFVSLCVLKSAPLVARNQMRAGLLGLLLLCATAMCSAQDDNTEGVDPELQEQMRNMMNHMDDPVDESALYFLTAANFPATIEEHKYMLVEFMAPWSFPPLPAPPANVWARGTRRGVVRPAAEQERNAWQVRTLPAAQARIRSGGAAAPGGAARRGSRGRGRDTGGGAR